MVDINETELIDSRPLSGLQIRTILLCGLVALLDGLHIKHSQNRNGRDLLHPLAGMPCAEQNSLCKNGCQEAASDGVRPRA